MLPVISKKNMAVDRLNHSPNDSLEIGRNGLRSRAAPVYPEELGEKTDLSALGEELGSGSLCPDLLPRGDLLLLQDEANGKNRALGVERLQAAVESAESCAVLEDKLPALVAEACSAVSDSHIKVCLAGLQLLDPLVKRTGSSLAPHLPSLVEAVLVKMGRNKHVLKRTGMKVLVQLMHYSRPQDVLAEVSAFGLRHKQSKVREESLNVITAALIRFPRSEFRQTQLAKEVVPLLADAKPNVRQACMECAAKIASLCDSKDDLRQMMSFAAKNGHHSPHHLAALNALECRVVRECGPPRLRDDGLIEYAMPVIGVDIPLSQHGPDVDWIRNGALSGEENVSNGLESSSVERKEAKLRPFRSATKTLPWEMDDAERSKLSKESDMTNSHLSDATADLGTTFTISKKPRNAASLLMHKRPPSSKQLFAKEGSGSPPSRRPPTGRRLLAPLSDADKKRSPSHSPNGSGTSVLVQDLRDKVPPTSRGGGPLPPPIPPPGSKLSRRHQSLPSRVANRDLPLRGHKPAHLANGSPQLSPIGSAAAGGSRQHQKTVDRSQPRSEALPSHAVAPPPGPGELSESWPRSRDRARDKGALATDTPGRQMELITADPLKMVGEVGDPVRTSILRPPSKPRACNPITMKQRQEKKKIKTSHLHQHQQQLQESPQDSPTQTEREFLMCANTTLQDEYYYSSVPEDTTGLDHSLSSSLTSLCRPHREPAQPPKVAEGEKLGRVRKEMGSRKAQHQSAGCSLSYSPQSSHDETPVGSSRNRSGNNRDPVEAVERRAKTGVIIEKDFNRTFTLGESLANADPSSISWQTLQALTQAAPTPPAPEVSASKKTKRKKKRRSGSNEGSGSSEGSEPTLSDNRTGAAGKPVQRHTVKMEVNGVKSPPPSQLSPEKELSPPAAPARGGGKKQRHSEPAFMFGSERKMAAATEAGSSPPTVTNRAITFAGDNSPEGSGEGLLPQVPRQPRKKHSKYAVVAGGKEDRQTNGHRRRRRDSTDSGVPVGENGSPLNGSLSDLQPFSSPERGLLVSLSQLDDSDWNEKCEGLMGVRRLAVCHPAQLIPELHTVTLAVVREVENLRSSVARAAIACLGDMFACAGRYMDPELERVVKVLLRKTGESNTFMREDVERTMQEIVQHATPGKLLLALISGGMSHRNVQVRRAAAQFLSQTVERYDPAQLLLSSRDLLERTLITTLSFVGDAAADPRYYGRVCLSHLMMARDFEKVASRTLNSKQWSKMRDAVDMIRVKGVGDPPSEAAPTARSRHPAGGTTRATSHAKRTGGPKTSVAVHCGENPPLPDRLVERLNAGDWEDRQEAINVLERFVDQYPKALEPHMHKVFDAFNPRLTDRNSKVNRCALQAFSNMVPLLGSLLAPLSANIIKALVPNLASKNSAILSAATTVFDLLSQCVDPACLFQPIATHSQHSNARVQPIMINKLAELAGVTYSQNARVVTRQVLPVVWHFLASKPPGSNEVKEAIVDLCETLYDMMGQSLMDSASVLPPRSQQRLNQILHSRNFS